MPDVIDREFDDIIAALREERPQIDPGFARGLDQRATDGFAKPPWHARLPSLTWLSAPIGAVAALVLVVAVIGGGGGSGGDGGGSSGAGTAAQGDSAAGSGSSSSAASPPVGKDEVAPSLARAGAGAPQADTAGGRLQEQSAAVTLEAPGKDVGDVGDRIIGVADQVGGFVTSSNVHATDGDSGGGDFRLRVPVARLDDALARLSRLAHVTERTQGSQDITAERNVVRDRYQEALAERTSLLKRLAAADSTPEVESLKAQLRDTSRVIAAEKTGLNQVVRRARYASLAVTLTAKPGKEVVSPADDGKWTPADAVRDAGRVLEVAAGVAVIVGSVLAPLALLGLLGLTAQRVAGRRGRQRVLETV